MYLTNFTNKADGSGMIRPKAGSGRVLGGVGSRLVRPMLPLAIRRRLSDPGSVQAQAWLV